MAIEWGKAKKKFSGHKLQLMAREKIAFSER